MPQKADLNKEWERADKLLNKSDSALKKLSHGVKKITSVEEFEGFISSL